MPHRPPRVLVVEDVEDIRDLISINLSLEGFDVSTAEDGACCLEVVDEVDPDVITLDVAMPRLDGFQHGRATASAAPDCKASRSSSCLPARRAPTSSAGTRSASMHI